MIPQPRHALFVLIGVIFAGVWCFYLNRFEFATLKSLALSDASYIDLARIKAIVHGGSFFTFDRTYAPYGHSYAGLPYELIALAVMAIQGKIASALYTGAVLAFISPIVLNLVVGWAISTLVSGRAILVAMFVQLSSLPLFIYGNPAFMGVGLWPVIFLFTGFGFLVRYNEQERFMDSIGGIFLGVGVIMSPSVLPLAAILYAYRIAMRMEDGGRPVLGGVWGFLFVLGIDTFIQSHVLGHEWILVGLLVFGIFLGDATVGSGVSLQKTAVFMATYSLGVFVFWCWYISVPIGGTTVLNWAVYAFVLIFGAVVAFVSAIRARSLALAVLGLTCVFLVPFAGLNLHRAAMVAEFGVVASALGFGHLPALAGEARAVMRFGVIVAAIVPLLFGLPSYSLYPILMPKTGACGNETWTVFRHLPISTIMINMQSAEFLYQTDGHRIVGDPFDQHESRPSFDDISLNAVYAQKIARMRGVGYIVVCGTGKRGDTLEMRLQNKMPPAWLKEIDIKSIGVGQGMNYAVYRVDIP